MSALSVRVRKCPLDVRTRRMPDVVGAHCVRPLLRWYHHLRPLPQARSSRHPGFYPQQDWPLPSRPQKAICRPLAVRLCPLRVRNCPPGHPILHSHSAQTCMNSGVAPLDTRETFSSGHIRTCLRQPAQPNVKLASSGWYTSALMLL
jgi:hypothetical protein